MTGKLRVPAYLQASTDVGGPARVEWLAALRDRVEELTARRGLDLCGFDWVGRWPAVRSGSARCRGRERSSLSSGSAVYCAM